MTKKDYELVAEILATVSSPATRRDLCVKFGRVFEDDNPLFTYDKFSAAVDNGAKEIGSGQRMRRYYTGGRYGYTAVDYMDSVNSERKPWVDTAITGIKPRKLAESICGALNTAYDHGYRDGAGNWPLDNPELTD